MFSLLIMMLIVLMSMLSLFTMMLGSGSGSKRVLGGRLFRHSASSSTSLRRNDLSVRVANSNKTRKGPSFFDEADVDAPVMRRRDNADPLKDDTPMWKQNYRPHFDKLDEETDRLLNGTEEEESEFAVPIRRCAATPSPTFAT